jgi:tRNA (guanine-N7-)-methyltransferase
LVIIAGDAASLISISPDNSSAPSGAKQLEPKCHEQFHHRRCCAVTEPRQADPTRRAIRSFVRRAGRITKAQRQALDELWPRFGLPSSALSDLPAAFGRAAPCVMEIGFGDGELLARFAEQSPEINFLGIDVYEPGVGHCLMRLRDSGIDNVRLVRDDAVDMLRDRIRDHSLRAINLFFPDPWPKKRHHKRRLVQPDFVALMAHKLEPGGEFHVATDWSNYAEHIDAVMSSSEFFQLPRDAARRPKTKFERRGERLGHAVWEAIYRRDGML